MPRYPARPTHGWHTCHAVWRWVLLACATVALAPERTPTAIAHPLDNIAFGTHFDDVIVDRLVLHGHATGTFIDIGGNHAYHHSNSMLFHNKGWRGVVVEPGAVSWGTHALGRPGDIALMAAAGAESGREVLLSAHGERSAVVNNATSTLVTPITSISLASACALLGNNVTFLSVDAEGLEIEIFRGNDWTTCRPAVILAETVHSRAAIRQALWTQNYRSHGVVGFNEVFVDGMRPSIWASDPVHFPAAASDPSAFELRWRADGMVHIAEIIRDAAALNLISDVGPSGAALSLPHCFRVKTHYFKTVRSRQKGRGKKIKVPVFFHQNQLSPRCAGSLMGISFLRLGEDRQALLPCRHLGARTMLIGFCQGGGGGSGGGVPCELLVPPCGGAREVSSVSPSVVAGCPTAVVRFNDSSAVALFNTSVAAVRVVPCPALGCHLRTPDPAAVSDPAGAEARPSLLTDVGAEAVMAVRLARQEGGGGGGGSGGGWSSTLYVVVAAEVLFLAREKDVKWRVFAMTLGAGVLCALYVGTLMDATG